MDDPWPSLSAQRAVAEAMFGAHGPVMVSEWFAGELSRTGDAAFARSFSDHIQLPGVEPGDYLHRLISTRWGRLLGGVSGSMAATSLVRLSRSSRTALTTLNG